MDRPTTLPNKQVDKEGKFHHQILGTWAIHSCNVSPGLVNLWLIWIGGCPLLVGIQTTFGGATTPLKNGRAYQSWVNIRDELACTSRSASPFSESRLSGPCPWQTPELQRDGSCETAQPWGLREAAGFSSEGSPTAHSSPGSATSLCGTTCSSGKRWTWSHGWNRGRRYTYIQKDI